MPRTIPGGMYKWTAWQDKGESWWHQVSGVPEVWPAGAEAVISQLVSSDIPPKLRQLTAYLQLFAEGPFFCLWKHTGAIFKSSQNPWSQHSTNDGCRVGGQMPPVPLPIGCNNSVSQRDLTGRSPVAWVINLLTYCLLASFPSLSHFSTPYKCFLGSLPK